MLPNSLKTEILVKASLREWIHIFKLRAVNPAAHPQIRQIMIPALMELHEKIPVVFDELMAEGFKLSNGSEFPLAELAQQLD